MAHSDVQMIVGWPPTTWKLSIVQWIDSISLCVSIKSICLISRRPLIAIDNRYSIGDNCASGTYRQQKSQCNQLFSGTRWIHGYIPMPANLFAIAYWFCTQSSSKSAIYQTVTSGFIFGWDYQLHTNCDSEWIHLKKVSYIDHSMKKAILQFILFHHYYDYYYYYVYILYVFRLGSR